MFHLIVTAAFLWHCINGFAHSLQVLPTIRSDYVKRQTIEVWLKKPLTDVKYLHIKVIYDRDTIYIENSYISWFLRRAQLPITLGTYRHMELLAPLHESQDITKQDNFVILTDMKHLRKDAWQFVQRAGVFFFIVTDTVDFAELRDVLHVMWKRYLVFRNYVLTSRNVLIYDPFALGNDGRYGKIVKYYGTESIEHTLFSNMRGYPLRVQIFKSVFSHPYIDQNSKAVKHVGGVDGRVAYLLQERLNFTMHIQPPSFFGERLPNGTFNGAIGSIIKSKLDICLTGFFVKDYFTRQIDFSVSVYDDRMCIFTPKAKRVPEYILPILSVKFEIWIIFISMAFLFSMAWLIFRYINCRMFSGKKLSKHNWLSTYCGILSDTWILWVRIGLNRYPTFSSEKVLVAFICLASVIFGSVFESSLATCHIYPMYFKDINTLKDLDESGLLIHYKYSSMVDDLFFSENSALFKRLHNKLVNAKNKSTIYPKIQRDVGANGGKAGVTRYNLLILESMDLIASKRIWIVPECPKHYLLSYVWPRSAPWGESFNYQLLRMLSYGFIEKFIAEMKMKVDLQIMKESLYEKTSRQRQLTLTDLQLAFYVIAFSFLTSTSCFLMEKFRSSTIKPAPYNNHYRVLH